jgi:hypothetical protein
MKTLTATPNYANKTFTIRKYENGKIYAKYRTIRLSDEEFYSCINNTENDWKDFLKSSDYYAI